MPDPIPTDDLYARLGVSATADTPAIDRAWRALLKRHHPDIAGSFSLELAKLINVAHDWLSHPETRARYDEAVRQREGRRSAVGRGHHRAREAAPPTPRRTWARHAERRPDGHGRSTPPDDLDDIFGATAPAIRSFLGQIASLTRNDLDRLSVSEPLDPVSELRDVIPPQLWTRIEALDARLAAVS